MRKKQSHEGNAHSPEGALVFVAFFVPFIFCLTMIFKRGNNEVVLAFRSILVLLFLSCLLLAAGGPAEAYTTVKVLEVPTVSADSTAALGTLLIKEEYANSISAGDWVTLSLPSYVELKKVSVYFPGGSSYWPSVTGATYSVDYTAYSPGKSIALGSSGVDLRMESKSAFSLIVKKAPSYGTGNTKTFRCYIKFDEVYIKPLPPGGSGKIEVNLDAPPGSGFNPGKETVANVVASSSAGGSTIVAEAPEALTDLGGKIAAITIKENAPGAFKVNSDNFESRDTVKLVLSPGFAWENVTLLPGWGWETNSLDFAVSEDNSGRSTLYLIINQKTENVVGRVVILGEVTVDESIARPGKVEVSYEGTNPGVTPAVVAVAEYNAVGVTAQGKTSTEVTAGRSNQPIGEFTIAEGMAGDLARGRTVTLTLPEGFKWNTYPTPFRESGDAELGEPVAVGNEQQTVKYTVTKAGSTKTIFRFKYGTVDVALGAPAKLDIALGGSCGLKGNVTVAQVKPPVTVAAEQVTVRIGLPAQDGGKLTITESFPGALMARNKEGDRAVLKLELPSGVSFAHVPKVKVTSGNLALEESSIRVESGDRVLVIPIKVSSTALPGQAAAPTSSGKSSASSETKEKSGSKEGSEPASGGTKTQGSTITVEEIALTLDRTVPEGTLKVKLSGSALAETEELFSNTLNELEVALATCVTPAPEEAKAQAVFTLGSKIYKVGDTEREMEVAPYVKNGRTYAPVRYLAYAVGLKDENIIWDEQNQTVTLLAGKRVAQFKVGQQSYFFQGVSLSMDAAPEVVNGRVMVPYRFVAQALGFKVEWKAETQQVVIY